jgi:hypothetical protein
MKYLKKFEAVIIPSKIESNKQIRSMDDMLDYGHENGFDVVGYDEFYKSLSEGNQKTAPPRYGIPFFALYHPTRKKPMFVICDQMVMRRIPNFKEVVDDIIGHEKVHKEQNDKRGGLTFSLPDPMKRKEYLSDKDEVMAFSWTIANGLSKTNRDIKKAMNELESNHFGGMPPEHIRVWNDIKRSCDEKTIRRYRKYIYMYLDKMLN